MAFDGRSGMERTAPTPGASTRSSATGPGVPAGRYVHCPYYMPEPLSSASAAVTPWSRENSQPGFRMPRISSLGTPHVSGLSGTSPPGTIRGSCASTSSNSSHMRINSLSYGMESSPEVSVDGSQAIDMNSVVLLPTRPLLKMLAKQCRPSPPWCVGYGAPSSLSDEVRRFNDFNSPTVEEVNMRQSCTAAMEAAVRRVWPTAKLWPMAATAAGQNVTKGVTLHFYATATTDATEEQQHQWMRAAIEAGAQVNFLHDDRELPCGICVDSRTGFRICIRYGSRAAAAVSATSALLASCIAERPVARAVFNTILTLLSQNKILDDSGTARTLLSGEAAAVMLLAVMNSYESTDVPEAGRVLLDFFLTYGFETYFNPLLSSVSAKGFGEPCPKRHPNHQLSILDPTDEATNITPSVDRVSNIQAIFNYCYTALSQYTQVGSNVHRAQSALSTVIGGEPYWVRVLRYYHLHIEPYHSFIHARRHILARYL